MIITLFYWRGGGRQLVAIFVIFTLCYFRLSLSLLEMLIGFRCTDMLEKFDKELSRIQGWREKAETTGSGEGEVDIREPYDAQAEAAWKEEHKKRVSNYKRALSTSTSQNEQVGPLILVSVEFVYLFTLKYVS